MRKTEVALKVMRYGTLIREEARIQEAKAQLIREIQDAISEPRIICYACGGDRERGCECICDVVQERAPTESWCVMD